MNLGFFLLEEFICMVYFLVLSCDALNLLHHFFNFLRACYQGFIDCPFKYFVSESTLVFILAH